MPGKTDLELEELAYEMGYDELKARFTRVPFSYGTTGHSGGQVELTLAAAEVHPSLRRFTLPKYDAGPRRMNVATNELQMMDMYYGNGGKLTRDRDMLIANFVLAATGLTGFGKVRFDPKVHVAPRLAFAAANSLEFEAWSSQDPAKALFGTSTTKEISRIIRWGLAEFGGILIFDGAEVNYIGVFQTTPPGGRRGDTDEEALSLFKYFTPGQHTVDFGTKGGKLVFHWYSELKVPSLLHFASTWVWNAGSKRDKLKVDRRNFMHALLGREPYWAAMPPGQREAEAKLALTGYAKTLHNPSELLPIWDNFVALPPDIQFVQAVREAQGLGELAPAQGLPPFRPRLDALGPDELAPGTRRRA